MPEPLSITKAAISSSAIFAYMMMVEFNLQQTKQKSGMLLAPRKI